jgi:hypothetical protein
LLVAVAGGAFGRGPSLPWNPVGGGAFSATASALAVGSVLAAGSALGAAEGAALAAALGAAGAGSDGSALGATAAAGALEGVAEPAGVEEDEEPRRTTAAATPPATTRAPITPRTIPALDLGGEATAVPEALPQAGGAVAPR